MAFTTEEKIQQLENLVQLEPNDYLCHFMLAKLYIETKNFPAAAIAADRCIALKPDYSAAYRAGGDAYRLAGEHERARDVYTRGIAVAEANRDLQTVKEMTMFRKKLGPK
ncbi:hypothetical protein IT570_10560 [Candidatus Sumerlaeota bacterium]|nr:hypothetical protein [Candidatus Sumerlaeota bacterium]